VSVVLPEQDSPILTQELLYTAVTRARQPVLLVGSEAAIGVAAARTIARSSGLGQRLWGL
jgi:exodeoxyribonuclease V alpha subunit